MSEWQPIICEWQHGSTVRCNTTEGGEFKTFYDTEAEGLEETGSGKFYAYLFISSFLILFAGAMSGLTIGLMSFDEKNLEILKLQSTNPLEKQRAKRVQFLIRDHHIILVTLLLWNAAAFESLPLFLDRLVPSWAAVLISVTLILIFGEVLPQAMCTGPRRLQIASNAFYLVIFLKFLVYPPAWVFARILDRVLGTREDRDSQFMYIPRANIGMDDDGRLALIEVHGYTDRPKQEKKSKDKKKQSNSKLKTINNDNDNDTATLTNAGSDDSLEKFSLVETSNA
eukprot:m.179950 g.179950  ORF g.179950 m.179950 type:complete len:283 (+) comp15485_c0_seq11:234-1082(+)